MLSEVGWVVKAMPRPLYPLEWPGNHCVRGYVGPSASLIECWYISKTGIRFPAPQLQEVGSIKTWCIRGIATHISKLAASSSGQITPGKRPGTPLNWRSAWVSLAVRKILEDRNSLSPWLDSSGWHPPRNLVVVLHNLQVLSINKQI